MKPYTQYGSHLPKSPAGAPAFHDLPRTRSYGPIMTGQSTSAYIRSAADRADWDRLMNREFGKRGVSPRRPTRPLSRTPRPETPAKHAERVADKIGKKMPQRRRKLSKAEAALKGLMLWWEKGGGGGAPGTTGSGTNPALTYLFTAAGTESVYPGIIIDQVAYNPNKFSSQQRSHTTQALVQGTYPFTAVLRLTHTPSNPNLPANDGWNIGDTPIANILPGRMSWKTILVTGTEYYYASNGTQPFAYARTVEYWKNNTGVTQPAEVPIELPSWTRTIPAPLGQVKAKRQREPRRLFIGYAPEFVIITDRRTGEVKVRTRPQKRGPGQVGKYRYKEPRVTEHKLATAPGQLATAKVLFSLLEMLDDATDLWDVLVEAFPPGLSRLNRWEQIEFLANPSNWRFFSHEAFIEGFTLWAAQEFFYGRLVSGVENRFGQNLGASNYFGTGITSRTWQDDPVAALHQWLFSL